MTRYVAEIDIQKVRSLFFVAASTAAGSRYLSRVLTAAAEDPSAEGGRSRAMPNKYLSFYNTLFTGGGAGGCIDMCACACGTRRVNKTKCVWRQARILYTLKQVRARGAHGGRGVGGGGSIGKKQWR